MLVTNTIQMYIEELFQNGNVIEICNFLENEYGDKYFSYNENYHEKLEKILLDLNNNLINAYLVQIVSLNVRNFQTLSNIRLHFAATLHA